MSEEKSGMEVFPLLYNVSDYFVGNNVSDFLKKNLLMFDEIDFSRTSFKVELSHINLDKIFFISFDYYDESEVSLLYSVSDNIFIVKEGKRDLEDKIKKYLQFRSVFYYLDEDGGDFFTKLPSSLEFYGRAEGYINVNHIVTVTPYLGNRVIITEKGYMVIEAV